MTFYSDDSINSNSNDLTTLLRYIQHSVFVPYDRCLVRTTGSKLEGSPYRDGQVSFESNSRPRQKELSPRSTLSAVRPFQVSKPLLSSNTLVTLWLHQNCIKLLPVSSLAHSLSLFLTLMQIATFIHAHLRPAVITTPDY